ncbi:hypothetical protein B484DRAFT_482627 [Ochromonadaceae sp. CCMP2298]|nr:hypothetical protein B484DRAFT_482627 [Ochromonadaceae sp. CCMP2298]
MSSQDRENTLLLGVVFASELLPKRGQEYRDRVRCEALENIGYNVRTLDNKHADDKLEKHCEANFSDTRRMMKSMDCKWPREQFHHVILDYFFSPVGWARHRWTDPLFTSTFPTLAREGKLAQGGQIWLPNLDCIQVSLTDFADDLHPYFTIALASDPKENPLYLATEDVEEELLRCPDALTNETQLRPLGTQPFYVLTLRDEFLPCEKKRLAPATPPAKKRKASSAPSSEDYFPAGGKTKAVSVRGKVGTGRTSRVASKMLRFDSK